MHLRHHFIASLILSILLFPIYSYQSLLVFVFGYFIDIDHYLWSIFKYGNFNFLDSYKYYRNRNIIKRDVLNIFHVVEFWFLLAAIFIIFKNDFFYPLLIGLVVHLAMDFIYEKVKNIKGERAKSLIFWLKRNKFI